MIICTLDVPPEPPLPGRSWNAPLIAVSIRPSVDSCVTSSLTVIVILLFSNM
ncbi:hypothetical protein PSPHG_CDS_0138 [Pseudomonas phage Psxphi15]